MILSQTFKQCKSSIFIFVCTLTLINQQSVTGTRQKVACGMIKMRIFWNTQFVFTPTVWLGSGKLCNLLTHCDFKLAGPSYTHNLQRHRGSLYMRWESLLQNSIFVRNNSFGGCREKNLVYNLQLANCRGLSKSIANTSNLHSCFDVYFISDITFVDAHNTVC